MKMLTDEPLLWKYGPLVAMPNLLAIFSPPFNGQHK